MNDDAQRILLVDLSALFHQAYHVSGGEDADATCRKTVARIRGVAQSFDRLVVCGDARRNWRHEKLPTYKAQRAAKPPEFGAQLERTIEILRTDGFPVWIVDGFEADDVVATATKLAVKAGLHVVIMTHDKDLYQLLGDDPIQILDINSGTMRGPADVSKDPGKASHSSSNGFGVEPEQLGDWLAIVGDASDNVPGVPGIGPKGATSALQRFGSIDGILDAVHSTDRLVEWNLRVSTGEDPAEVERQLGPRPVVPDPPIKPAALAALKANEEKLRLSRELIGLRFDVPIDFAEAMRERVQRPLTTPTPPSDFDDDKDSQMTDDPMNDTTPAPPPAPAAPPPQAPPAPESKPDQAQPDPQPEPPAEDAGQAAPSSAMVTSEGFAPAIAAPGMKPQVWQHTLEPTTLGDAMRISRALHESRLFAATFNSPAGIFAAHLLARAHGVETMKLLMPGMVHNIKGKLAMSAIMIVGLILRSGKCEAWDLVETTAERATYVTKRVGSKREIPMTFTIEEARAAGYLGKADSSWAKTPKTMLRHRCETELGRAVYPDVVGGLYTPDEMGADL